MRSTRFQPDPLDHALIDFGNDEKNFKPRAVGLILNESYTGCALIIHTQEVLRPNQIILLQVGRLGVMPGKVIWTKSLDDSILKVGLQFQD